MKNFKIYFWSAILIFYIQGCQECDDCENPITENTVGLTFINQENLLEIKILEDAYQRSIDSLGNETSILNTNISIIQDSISAVNDSISLGGILDDLLDVLTNKLLSYTELEAQISNELNIAENNLILQQYELVKAKSGLTKVDTIFNNLNNNYLTFNDSASVFNIPLNFNDSISDFGISIGGIRYQLSLGHTNELYIDIRGNVMVLISEIDTISNGHNFKQIELACPTKECKANETIILCYF